MPTIQFYAVASVWLICIHLPIIPEKFKMINTMATDISVYISDYDQLKIDRSGVIFTYILVN